MEEIKFKYGLGVKGVLTMLMVIIISGAFGIGFAHMALNNDQGLIINDIIELSVTGATIFLWCLAAVMLACVTVAVRSILKSITSKREIVITVESITAPYSVYSSKEVKINLAEITKLSVVSGGGYKTLHITARGAKLQIPSMALGRSKNFKALTEALRMKVGRLRNRA